MSNLSVYYADLHIHSPYSIAVSQNISLETLNHTAQLKGINILGTGDITQPNWLNYMRQNLEKRDQAFYFKETAFVLQTELEDAHSIHQLVLLPDFSSVQALIDKISPYVANISGRWAGRPHVHRSPEELVEIVSDVNGLIGPAHAFTPFKSVFRQGKFNSLHAAYGTAVKKLAFLELGLSADSILADRMEELQNITFLSNSDAHSEGPDSLGREFNRFAIESPTFEEIKQALSRRGGRKIILNAGLDPRLGKYYKMFCSKCRRRVISSIGVGGDRNVKNNHRRNSLEDIGLGINFRLKEWDDLFICYDFPTRASQKQFIRLAAKKQVECPACRKKIIKEYKSSPKNRHEKTKNSKRKPKIPRIQLGVSERIDELSTWENPHHPSHRPPYLHTMPLIEILAKILGVKSVKSKTVQNYYRKFLEKHGTECHILVEKDLSEIGGEYARVAEIIQAFRDDKVSITPGGGGTFGDLDL